MKRFRFKKANKDRGYGIAIKGNKYGFGFGFMKFPWAGKDCSFGKKLLCFEPFYMFSVTYFQVRFMWFVVTFISPPKQIIRERG